ncbi:MAG: response regulator [Burkholderiaceae bacterium]
MLGTFQDESSFRMSDTKPLRILMVEDNPGDVRLVKESMIELKIKNDLFHVPDGETGLAYLRREGDFANAVLPDMVLLDLNLPGIGGRDTLAIIKSEEELKHIPVVILTSSEAEADVLRTYQLQANCYVVKPLNLDQFLTVVQSIEHFWFSIVRLPSRNSPL